MKYLYVICLITLLTVSSGFKIQTDPPLEGTQWKTHIFLSDENAVGIGIAKRVYITFTDGIVNGDAICNSPLKGKYTTSGNNISITDIISDEYDCIDRFHNRKYINTLTSVAKYEISGDSLRFYTAADSVALVFTKK